MRADVIEIPSIKRESQRKLTLDISFRDAVADYLTRRWPSGTAKAAAREFDLSLPRAREAVARRASLTTVEAIIKRGGWLVALQILEAVIGQQLARFITELRKSHDQNSERLASLAGDLWPGGHDRHPAPDIVDARQAERRGFGRRRVG